jgi:hypothetical protein
MSGNNNEDDFRRDIERSLLNRGEYDQVLEGRAAGVKIFAVMVVIGAVLCFGYKLLGIAMDGTGLLLAAAAVVAVGFGLMCLYANTRSR